MADFNPSLKQKRGGGCITVCPRFFFTRGGGRGQVSNCGEAKSWKTKVRISFVVASNRFSLSAVSESPGELGVSFPKTFFQKRQKTKPKGGEGGGPLPNQRNTVKGEKSRGGGGGGGGGGDLRR